MTSSPSAPSSEPSEDTRRHAPTESSVQTGLGPGTGAADDPAHGAVTADTFQDDGQGLAGGQSEQGGWRGTPVGNPSDQAGMQGAPAQDPPGNAHPPGDRGSETATPFRGGEPHWPHGQPHDDERGGGGDWARSTEGNSYRGGPRR